VFGKARYKEAFKVMHAAPAVLLSSGSARLWFSAFIGISVLMAVLEVSGIFLLVPVIGVLAGGNFASNHPLFGTVMDLLKQDTITETIATVAILFGLVTLLKGVLEYLANLFSGILVVDVQEAITRHACAQFLGGSIPFVQAYRQGEHRRNVWQAPKRLGSFTQSVAVIIMNGIVSLFYLVMLFIISGVISLAALGFTLVVVLLTRLLDARQRRYGRRLTEVNKAVGQKLIEMIANMKLIRLSRAELPMYEAIIDIIDQRRESALAIRRVKALGKPVLTVATGLIIALALYGGTKVYEPNDVHWVGILALYLIALQRFVGPVGQCNVAFLDLAAHWPALEIIVKYLDEIRAHPQATGTRKIGPLRDRIEFRNISFRYRGQDVAALEGIDMVIERGQMVALVGRSGAGKSTLVQLLARLYEPTGGRILIDGVPLSGLDTQHWLGRIGLVSQEVVLLNDTVADNIRFARRDATDEEVREAARLAQAEEFIIRLPNGYDTEVGEAGELLSGGQRQRIAIARVLLEKPDIIVLDEATSQLDAFTDDAVTGMVKRMRGQHTIIFIAHRMLNVVTADRIYVLEAGKVLETGTHQSLLAKGGLYRKMIDLQRISGDVEPVFARGPAD
jgi:subfamily B ATP-binding cassette protein MsbA